jgi:hypothetical protein
VEQGKASDDWTGPDNRHPRHTTGVNASCPLSKLHLFDIIWDICPDMMHIIKNFFEKLTMQVFSGARVPSWSAGKHPMPNEDDDDYETKMAAYNKARDLWTLAVNQNKKCIFSAADQELADRRMKNLVGPANWIKNSMVRSSHIHMHNSKTNCIHMGLICILIV